SPKDIQAGMAAGCRTVLVRGHNGVEMPPEVVPHFVAGNLLSAVQEIRKDFPKKEESDGDILRLR
ncbi:MAG: hypothetical protein AAB037_05745, partial [Chloroflexota bacterium]